jgi:hypothetical protein
MLTDKLVKKTLDKALQLANIASDWNLSEVEIDGEMVDIYDLTGEFEVVLATLNEQPQMAQAQPLDSPDGPGWWAFEGHWATFFPERAVIFHRVYDVYLMTDEQWYFQMGNDGHPVGELTGKWWRISLPWDAPAPPVIATARPQEQQWQSLPDDVGDAIAGLIGFACNPDHMDRESLVMAYTVSKWFDINARPQGKDDSDE